MINFAFWHEILLDAQTAMEHLRFDFFCNEQRQETHDNWNVLVTKKAQMGGGREREGGRLTDLMVYFFKNPRVIRNIFFRKTMEFLGLLLYPWSLLTRGESFTPGNRIFSHCKGSLLIRARFLHNSETTVKLRSWKLL